MKPIAAAVLVLASALAAAGEGAQTLRVCADGNNMPFSNDRGEGFENALAELLAGELDREVAYAWFPQRRGFIRNTLNAGRCDLVMSVPADYELTATSVPYYRSSYVLVTRRADGLGDLHALEDRRLRDLRIGLHTVGDDYSNPPPAQALARLGVKANVRGYSIYGDYSEADPPRRLIDALAAGEIDVAIAWGPTAGWFALQQEEPLALTPISSRVPLLPMAFDIALGVRRGDEALRDALNQALERRRGDIAALLRDFGVPRQVPAGEGSRATEEEAQ